MAENTSLCATFSFSGGSLSRSLYTVGFMRWSLLLSLVVSSFAFASPVGLGVGETKHVTVSQKVAKVETSDAARVEISYKGSTLTLTGKETGRTTVHLTTVDGAEVSLDVHVVTPGSRIFAVEKAPARPVAKREKAAGESAEAQAKNAP